MAFHTLVVFTYFYPISIRYLVFIGNSSKIIHQSRVLIFCEKSVFFSPNLLNNQSDFLKFLWRHDFVQDKLDPRRSLKMVDKTMACCIIIESTYWTQWYSRSLNGLGISTWSHWLGPIWNRQLLWQPLLRWCIAGHGTCKFYSVE